MSPEQHLAVQQTILGFWRALDRRDYGAVLGSLTEDCLWLRERWIQGQSSISTALAKRPADLRIRHLVSNLILETDGAGVTASYIVTAFSGSDAAGGDAPLPAAAPSMVADLTMTCVLSEGRWRIGRIEPAVCFRQPGH